MATVMKLRLTSADRRDEIDALMRDMEASLERMNTHDGAASLKRAG